MTCENCGNPAWNFQNMNNGEYYRCPVCGTCYYSIPVSPAEAV
ncbi:hypothetical protein [Methanosarcina horonobensis]|nr:hypothetical protein [Methanosarcina horonobensis]